MSNEEVASARADVKRLDPDYKYFQSIKTASGKLAGILLKCPQHNEWHDWTGIAVYFDARNNGGSWDPKDRKPGSGFNVIWNQLVDFFPQLIDGSLIPYKFIDMAYGADNRSLLGEGYDNRNKR